jgi:exopolysaccharide biosynthesis polyprenyl glycosylphosphotransferase
MSEAQIASMMARPLCPEAPVLSLQTQRLILKFWLVLSDALVLGGAFLAAYWLRFSLEVTTSPGIVPSPYFYPFLAAIMTVLSLLVFAFFRLYDLECLLGGVTEYSKTFNACSTATMTVVVATFLFPQFVVARFWVVASWVLSFLLVAFNRFLYRRMVYSLRRRGYFLTPAVIVGTNEEAATLAKDLSEWHASGLRLVGFVACGPHEGGHHSLPVLGDVSDIRRIITAYGIEDLIVAITGLKREELLELCEDVNVLPDVHMRLSSGVYELLTTGLTVQTKGTVPLISLNKVRLEMEEAFIKAVLEYSVAGVGLLLLSPVLLFVAALIKLDSSGPVLHRRRVLGVSGTHFDAYKFRTMYVTGDELLSGNTELQERLRNDHKLKNDPRITRVGRWLRKYSLDELPQLVNVIRGQMGLVGPRMITPDEAEKYGRHRLNLLTVKPGITGLWQVSGRSDLSYDERVQLDMYYIRNYSVWMDLQILCVQTVPAVFNGRGAY